MPNPPRQTAAFWFTSNFLPGPLAIGFIGPLQGLTLWQSLLAIIPAVLLGNWLGHLAFGKVSDSLWRSFTGLVLGISALAALWRLLGS